MDNSIRQTDLKVGTACFGPQGKSTEEQLAVELWNEISKIPGKVGSALKELPGAETFQRILESIPEQVAAKKAKQTDWTIAIDFTTDFGDGQGVDSGLERLQELAKQTKGKNIAIIAQAAIADTDEFDDFGNPIITKDTKYKLERYLVKDGEVTQIDQSPSKGYAADLEALLSYASKNQPSKRTALIIDSHGLGNEGLLGDSGTATVDEFVNAVQNGIKESGREKLDMIDFDCCLMASNTALSRFAAITDNVVASAQTESIYQGQNYVDPIKRLMEKPETDGLTFSRDIVAATHKEMELWKEDGWHPAVETLAHFTLREYGDFRKSLESFGEKLASSIDDKENKVAIEAAIDDSRKYGSIGVTLSNYFGDRKVDKHRTDLKEFAENIIAAIDSGEIKDPDRSLKKSAQEVLNKRSNLVDSYHGNAEHKRSGGIADFIPGRNLRNITKEAELQTSAGRINELTQPKQFSEINKNDKSRAEFLQKIEKEMFWNRPHWIYPGAVGAEKEVKQVDKCTEDFRNATTDQQREAAFKLLHQATQDLRNTDMFKALYQSALKETNEKAAKVYKINLVEDSANGWSRFRVKLKDGK